MDARYENLRQAIKSSVLATKEDGTLIIGSELSGNRIEWIFNFRALLLHAKWLDRYAEIFWEQYADKLPFQVGAMETAGITLVSAIVMKSVERGTPINGFYIRKSRKRQGLMKQVEGTLTDDPIVLVDDLINMGMTFDKQLAVLADTGKKVTDIFTILSYREPSAYKRFEDAGISVRSLFTLKDFGVELPEEHVQASVRFEEVWRYTGPNPSFHAVLQKSAPITVGDYVYFGCDDGTMRALEQKSGAIAWEFSVGKHPEGKGILSTPTLYNDTLYFGAYDGVVYALDAKTGKKKWSYDDADWIGSSPSIAPDLGMLFIGLEFGLFRKHGGIIALDLKTGKKRWQQITPAFTHCSPLYIEQENIVAVGSNDGVCYGYDAKSGTVLWRYTTRGEIKVAPAYDAKHRVLFFASMDGKLYALSAQYGEPLYAFETGAGLYSIPLVHKDMVYTASLDKSLYAIDIASGKLRWSFETRGRIFGSPSVIDDSVYVGSNDGCFYEIDSSTGKYRGHFQASERILSKMAYSPISRHMFVRTVANELYCLARFKNNQSAAD